MIERLTAVVLQGQTKKTRTFQLVEVKPEPVTPDVCKECICYSTNAAIVDLGMVTESSNRYKLGKKEFFYIMDGELIQLLPWEVAERRQMVSSRGKQAWRKLQRGQGRC